MKKKRKIKLFFFFFQKKKKINQQNRCQSKQFSMFASFRRSPNNKNEKMFKANFHRTLNTTPYVTDIIFIIIIIGPEVVSPSDPFRSIRFGSVLPSRQSDDANSHNVRSVPRRCSLEKRVHFPEEHDTGVDVHWKLLCLCYI